MKQRKRTHSIRPKTPTTTAQFSIAFLISAAITILMSSIWSLLILKEVVPQGSTLLGAVTAVTLGSFCGCMALYKNVRSKKLPAGYLLIGIEITFAMLMQLTIIKGSINTCGPIIIGKLSAATAAGLLAARPKKRRH